MHGGARSSRKREFGKSERFAACQSIAPRTWDLPVGVKTIPANGYELAYVEKGSGVPVILVHGIGVDYRYFTASMDALATRHRVISISLRHHYPERWDGKGDYNFPLLAGDVVAFIRALSAGPVHVVGHSHGGTVVFFVARQAPELLRSVTSAEGMSITSFAPKTTDDGATAAKLQTLFESGDVDGGLQVFVTAIGGSWDKLPDSIKQSLRDNAWTIYRNSKFAGAIDFPCESLRPLTMPVLLIQGEKTAPQFSKTLDNLAPCLARVERATITGGTHVFPRTHPADFSKVVLDFVSKY